jgi:hypothetical protein
MWQKGGKDFGIAERAVMQLILNEQRERIWIGFI